MNDTQPTPTHGAPTHGAGGDGNARGIRHMLYPYRGEKGFLDGTLPYIDQALRADALVVVAAAGERRQALRDQIGDDGAGGQVFYLDAAALGRNPARLIPAWRAWLSAHTAEGQQVRAIGDNGWGSRSTAEVSELRYHEWLLNLAFAGAPEWWLLCPYDVSAPAAELESALRGCHPLVLADGRTEASPDYHDTPYTFDELPVSPCGEDRRLHYRDGQLGLVREYVSRCATQHGLTGDRLRDLLVAATEIAANSIAHGGGQGTVAAWAADGMVICEFHDAGQLTDPLAGRIRPTLDQDGGRGLWLANQICDLVQIRAVPHRGTTVRLHMYV